MIGLAHRILVIVLSFATSICLAYGMFGAGFAVCTTPQATAFIGATFSGWEHATYPEEDMAKIAEEVRSFSVEGGSSEDLYETIRSTLEKAEPQIAAIFETGSIADSGIDASDLPSADLATLEEEYSLPRDALSHLEDCTPIFTTGRISAGVVGAFGIIGLIALGIIAGRKRVGGALIAASSLVIGVLIALGIWAVVDFDSLFTWMHSLLFVQGTWTFDADSLLITLFPEAFWAAMAGLWIIASIGFSLVAGIIGKIIAR